MAKKSVILFDIGGVLLDWSADYAMDKIIPDSSVRKRILDKIDFYNWNDEWDIGTLADCVANKKREFPEYADIIQAFDDRWLETLGPVNKACIAIMRDLKQRGYRLYAASNFAADAFMRSRSHLTFLDLFDELHVSGFVGAIKPGRIFFEIMMQTNGFQPDEAVFIDDKAVNCEGARAVGIDSILFKSAPQTRQELIACGLLTI